MQSLSTTKNVPKFEVFACSVNTLFSNYSVLLIYFFSAVKIDLVVSVKNNSVHEDIWACFMMAIPVSAGHYHI